MAIERNGFDIPEQLSENFFKKAIETGLIISNIDIKNILFTMGSSGGDNYASQIFRALVTYSANGSINNISLIIKYLLLDGTKDFLGQMQVYEREVKMYKEIIPKLEKLLGNNNVLSPKIYYTVSEPVQTIVFEDLNVSNYEIVDRVNGLDEEHTKILLEKIGKFHAASMVLAKKNPESMKFFNRSIFDPDIKSKVLDEICLGNLLYLKKLLKTWPGFESIAIKLGKIQEYFYENIFKVVVSRKDGFSVLNHGDLWINNFMFKKDTKGAPIDVALIDLQISYYGSLGLDINYFLNTSVRIDVLKSKRYELIRFYYGSLKETLEKLNYSEIPSWDQVRTEIFATELYGIFAFVCVLPIIAMDREASEDNSLDSFDDFEKAEKKREIAFGSNRMKEVLKYSLDRFDELGVLDVQL